MFTDREFFMRSHGQVRFLTIFCKTAKTRCFYGRYTGRRSYGWSITLVMTVNQMTRCRATASGACGKGSGRQPAAESRDCGIYRKSIDGVAEDLKQAAGCRSGANDRAVRTAAQRTKLEHAVEIEEKPVRKRSRKSVPPFPRPLRRLPGSRHGRSHLRIALTRAAHENAPRTAEAAIREIRPQSRNKLTKNGSAVPMWAVHIIPFFSEVRMTTLHPTLERLNIALATDGRNWNSSVARRFPSAMPADMQR